MTTDEPSLKPLDLGPTGWQLAHNLKRIRTARGISLRDLSPRLRGVKLSADAINKIEKQQRRATTDELMALAVALGVTPNTLLLPPSTEGYGVITGHDTPLWNMALWAWGDGLRPLTTGPDRRKAMADFEVHARPDGPDPRELSGDDIRAMDPHDDGREGRLLQPGDDPTEDDT